MAPLLILFCLIFIGFAGYIAQLNPGRVTLFLTSGAPYEVSVTSLVLFSSALGGGLVILFSGFYEMKGFVLNWKHTRQKKKQAQIDAYYAEAMNASLAKRYREAIVLFQKIIDLNASHLPTFLKLGKIYRIEGNYVEAIRLHRKARILDERNVEVLLALVSDFEEAKRHEEAIQMLKEILHLDGANLTALMRLRDIKARMSEWEEAHEIQEKVMKLSLPENVRHQELACFLGMKYEAGMNLLKSNHLDGARRYFSEAIKFDKEFLPAYMGLADIHTQEGRHDLAVRLLIKAYETTSNLILLHRIEDLCLEMGEPEKILHLYRENILKNSDHVALKFYLGKLYFRLEMVDDAYETLCEIEPQIEYFPDLYKILANLYVRRGDLAMAVDAFKKSLKLKKHVLVSYYCSKCDYHTVEWAGKCDRCAQWNSYQANPIMVERTPQKSPPETLYSTSYPRDVI